MLEMNYDTKKAPLGKLTKQQIKAGYEALKEIEALVNAGKTTGPAIIDACNRFYTKIPHDFGFNKPPMINTLDAIKQKVNLLEALGEIEIAMKVLQDKTEAEVRQPPTPAVEPTRSSPARPARQPRGGAACSLAPDPSPPDRPPLPFAQV